MDTRLREARRALGDEDVGTIWISLLLAKILEEWPADFVQKIYVPHLPTFVSSLDPSDFRADMAVLNRKPRHVGNSAACPVTQGEQRLASYLAVALDEVFQDVALVRR